MREALIYLLQANLCLLILYLAYHFGLRRSAPFKHLRLFLLGSLLLSLVLPIASGYSKGGNTLIEIDLQEILVYQLNGNVIGVNEYPVSSILKLVYLIGCTIAALLFIYRLTSITILINKGEKHHRTGHTLVRTSKKISTFSFFHYLVISKANPEPVDEIIVHEKAHIKHFHSMDIVIVELMKIAFWFNPVIYFYKEALREIHEYQADAEVVSNLDNPKEYIELILGEAFGVEAKTLTNTFFNSGTLTKRINAIYSRLERPARLRWFHWVIVAATLMLAVKAAFTIAAPNWVKNDKNVFTQVDVMPEYPGGMGELMGFIGSQVNYPQELIEQNVQGTVYVKFVISKNGQVGQVKVIKGVHPQLDEEASNAVAQMPRWIPGENNGEAVAVSLTIPIKFAL